MSEFEAVINLAHAGSTAILLAVLWEVLKRFDKLLEVLIRLAEKTETDEHD